jgi:hypothetical protein
MISTHQLIYVSAAIKDFPASQLTSLLLRARDNNRRLGISGLLIHHSGSFFQVLEGGEVVVETLFQRIAADPRHHRVLVLQRGNVKEPSFGDWSMGFVEGERAALQRVPGFNDFFRQGFANVAVTDLASRATSLALAFRDGRFRQFVAA